MWQDRQAELLQGEIDELLAPLSDNTELYNLVQESLNEVKRRIASQSEISHPWPLLPLVVSEVISGHYEHALPAAAALQLFIVAGDVFDDIEDADSSTSISAKYGFAIATNVATTLLILAEKAITLLKDRNVDDCVIVRVMDVVNSSFVNTCAGQHLDLSISSESDISEDKYLKIVDMKTASSLECACNIGALLATNRQEIIETFAGFGRNLGMVSQIANDIQGIIHGNDILKRKMTLPVIYALSQADRKSSHQLKIAYDKGSKPPSELVKIKDLLFNTGAIHYATIKMEMYRQRALDILSSIGAKVASVERLRLFIE